MCLDFARNKSVRSWLLLLTAGLLASAPAVHAAEPNWLDIESRIQYGYFTEDTRSLHNLVEPLDSNDSHDRLKSYYAGLLAYRLTLLAQAQADPSAATGKAPAPVRRNDRSKDEARQAVERCVGSLDQALEVQSNFAEALALQSACLGMLADLGTWRARLAAPKSATQLRKALQIAPKNPRVLLLDAISDYEHAKGPASDAEHTCSKFKTVAALFDAERADVDQVPGWGAAEGYMWLGRCYLDIGNPNEARDALERALLIAPEFGQARRLLATITSG
ncbi:MAG TPA: tetratricopeptide repeat protein [Steroidobacteraceae bacterium]|nr:tetratricopeptide repeat protein [Steroidobacteraceae bacterium]